MKVKLHGVYVVPTILIGGLMYCGIAAKIQRAKDEKQKYIVTAKADRKVEYVPIENSADLHVMEFGAYDVDSFWYKYMNVGDTIVGDVSELSKPVAVASLPWNGKSLDSRTNVIYHVNGKDLQNAKWDMNHNAEIARRDSILREMKMKQR